MSDHPRTNGSGRQQRELTEALTAAVMATEAYRRWAALGEGASSDVKASLELVIEEAERMRDAAKRLLSGSN